MGMTTEQFIEYALIQIAAGQSQNQKQVYRFELEAMSRQALIQLGREVAVSPDYQVLQRTISLPVSSAKDLAYNRFGPSDVGIAGKQPILDNGIFFGEQGAFAVAAESLAMSGSPLQARSQWLEWQFLTNDKSVTVGVVPVFASDVTLTTPIQWEVALRVQSPGVGDVFANGVQYPSVFASVVRGDIFQFIWDASGALTILQLDSNRVGKGSSTIVGGQVTQLAMPAVAIFGIGGQVTIGRIGTGTVPPSIPQPVGGLYRVDLKSQFQFLTSFFDETGTIVFDGTTTRLSWVPSLNYYGSSLRCDIWYWTLDGEQIVFWHGGGETTLPANSLRITGSIIPTSADLPVEYHQRAIDILVETGQKRQQMGRHK